MRLEIQCEDRIGMVREALDLFIPYQIDLRLVEVDTKRRCLYCGFSDIPFPKLQRLLADIRRLDSVEDVKTVMFTPSEREHNALYTLLEALPDGVISVDLKGQITMVTELAAEDLKMPISALLHKPLQQCIKDLHFSKEMWANPQNGVTKRIQIRDKPLLLEMKPIYVCDDDGVSIPAGTVIYVKSKARLDRQAERLKQAPDADNPFEAYFDPTLIKSTAMRNTLHQAKAFAEVSVPMLVQGEVGTGKRDLIDALFQYWYKRQGDRDAQQRRCHAREVTPQVFAEMAHQSGWWVIDDIECLDESAQSEMVSWLARQPSMRLICVSSLSQSQLASGTLLNKALYFSMVKLVISVPPLRDRKEDLEGLLKQCVVALAERYRKPVPAISKGALVKLALYDWPGNLQELHNVCLQTLLSKGAEWSDNDISLPDRGSSVEMTLLNGSLEETTKHWEASLLKQLYPRFPSTRRLAKAVGMSHSAIANKLKEYGIKA
ncbi:transcriptional regulator [Marinomonas hwangdonensis]|uniref:Transcriptional regulator n=1 Tax=Marinomonas hwangdonensis TaxID=1053647 RepID=A0A3M8Q0J3_9GAMM|nr:TyrR/PhhR family helix-turn-helix DNA-binding protein [Marinomonas hwangdonensis]RNF49655.1 transcriptional regulator [Marinomonas hwangdonensis]